VAVTTDNSPVHFEYISQRLTREIVQQHEAARTRTRLSPSLRLGIFTLGLRSLSPDYPNRYDRAMRATQAVRDNTGTIDSPGVYVRARLCLKRCKVAFHQGFENTGSQEVAGFFADEEVSDVGRVFVLLLGSLKNLTGWRAAERLVLDSNPSDAAGMYEILRASLEPNDSKIDHEHLEWDREMSPLTSFEAADRLAHRHDAELRPTRTLDFLAVNHLCASDVDIHGRHYDVALLGAPVWVSSPPPKPWAVDSTESAQ
jgi:hypothetical protein